MSEIAIFYILVITGIFASSCSQILLKRSADRPHSSWLRSMLNWRVITAYAIFFASLFINITAMSHGINLKDLPILEALGYIFVPLLSLFILKESITRLTLISILIILTGIIIFYL